MSADTQQQNATGGAQKDFIQRTVSAAFWLTLLIFCCYTWLGTWKNAVQYAVFSLWGVIFLLVIRRVVMAIFRKDKLAAARWGAANLAMMATLFGLCLAWTFWDRLSAPALLLGIHTIYLVLIVKALGGNWMPGDTNNAK